MDASAPVPYKIRATRRQRRWALLGRTSLMLLLAFSLMFATSAAAAPPESASAERVERTAPPARPTERTETNDQNSKIEGTSPKFDLGDLGRSLSMFAADFFYGLFRPVVAFLCSCGDFLLSFVTDSASTVLRAGFDTGIFKHFYIIASNLADRVFKPVSMLFLGVTLSIAMLRTADPRYRQTGHDDIRQLLMLIAAFAVCYLLCRNAMRLCGAIYEFGSFIVGKVDVILAGLGYGRALDSGLADALLVNGYLNITYNDAGNTIVYLLLAGISLFIVFGTVLSVLTTVLLRMGEIYLRAAASPLALALMLDDRTRPAGMAFAKRFFALGLQAVIIFIALSMAPLFFTVGSSLVQGIQATELGGFAGAIMSVIPSFVSITIVGQVVRLAEPVSNSVFGL